MIYAAFRSRTGASFLLVERIADGDVGLHLSVPVVIEYRDVLARDPRAFGLSKEDVDVAIDALCSIAELHDIHYLWRPVLPDPKDEIFLELAVAAQCRRIVTHNVRDFVGAGAFGVDAVTPLQFLQEIGVLP